MSITGFGGQRARPPFSSLQLSLRALAAIAPFAVFAFVAVPAPPAWGADPSADLVATVEPSFVLAYPGGTFGFGVTVTNNGPDAASGVTVSETWYGASTFLIGGGSAPAGAACTLPPRGGHGSVTCTTPSLAPGASMSVGLTLHVLGIHNMTVTGSATATSATPDPNTANNSASAWVRVE